jgi:malate dehydrogenase (oxaloacetate-decarboxylating)
MNDEERLAKADLPRKMALKYHPYYRGKISVAPKVPIRTVDDFGIWYTPGVAEPCKLIKKDVDQVFDLTNRWNSVAVVSDGTRVLGLGNIGAEAALPVMEGKALLFKYLGGVDAFPLCLGTETAEEMITAVKWVSPTFGGINLEDIEKPKCFHILDRLRKEINIPVWHDDQQGTALVTVAGLINALKVVGKRLSQATVALIGAGAANINVARYLIVAGARPGNIMMVDSKGILTKNRTDVKDDQAKWEMCLKTNSEARTGGIPEAMKGADACISLSTPGPGVIKKEWVANMASDSIIFTCANPTPEIWPWEAEEAGAKVTATGRSDFPNQVNNSLGFPAVFRGALDVAAKTITDEMCISAAYAVADYAERKGIHSKYIIPTMNETEMYVEEAVAVGLKAIDQAVARKKLSKQELSETASEIINSAQRMTKFLMKEKIIKPADCD